MRNAAFCITGLALQGLSMSLMAQTDKPNIVIIMTDQQRADLCGREGFPLAVTPYVDQLAQENVWFNKAYTVAPASSPAAAPCSPDVFLRQPMYVPTTTFRISF